ncbi:MAG: DNA repair protein RecO [Pirellulales bacterium]|nr:DNA repair protein RecO [Pirellulales bacterium]
MSAEKDQALVLRFVDFSESSGVVTLLTREFGKISTLAKGARRPKGPFESALDLLALCRVVFLRKSSGNLDLLTEAKLERRFRPPGRDLSRLYAGYYIAEMLDRLTDEYDPHPRLFDTSVETLATLARHPRGLPAAWVLRWELALLRELGQLPTLDQCAECGNPLPPQSRLTYGVAAGGMLCAECRIGQRQLISVALGVPGTLAEFAASTDPDRIGASEDWRDWTIPAEQWGEVRGVINQTLWQILGERPRVHAYLGGLTH